MNSHASDSQKPVRGDVPATRTILFLLVVAVLWIVSGVLFGLKGVAIPATVLAFGVLGAIAVMFASGLRASN